MWAKIKSDHMFYLASMTEHFYCPTLPNFAHAVHGIVEYGKMLVHGLRN